MNPLKFYYLKYTVADINTMIKTCPDMTNFVFTFTCQEADGYLQLVSNALAPQGYYQNTQTLEPYRNQACEITGPVTMSNNYLSVTAMKALIGQPGASFLVFTPGLVFTPLLPTNHHICYAIAVYTEINGMCTVGTGSGSTYPSPPNT